MNREHLRAFLWLRWRLRVNQFKKAGTLNLVLVAIAAAFAALAGVGMFFLGFAVGLLVLPKAPPVVRLYVWDGIVLAFLFTWMIGMMADIQRSDALSIDKFLHLPVSPVGAFVVNYLSSLVSLTLIIFAMAMTGLLLGQLFAHGRVCCSGSRVAAFPAGGDGPSRTSSRGGWRLMANPRRRRTIIVFLTGGVIFLAQAPNLVNVIRPWESIDPRVGCSRANQRTLRRQAAGRSPGRST